MVSTKFSAQDKLNLIRTPDNIKPFSFDARIIKAKMRRTNRTQEKQILLASLPSRLASCCAIAVSIAVPKINMHEESMALDYSRDFRCSKYKNCAVQYITHDLSHRLPASDCQCVKLGLVSKPSLSDP